MTTMCRTLALVIVAVLLVVGECQARKYGHGDLVPSLRRSYFNTKISEWSSLPAAYCPRFLRDRQIALPTISPTDYYSERGFKIAFAFDENTLITPWISVADESAAFLTAIEFTFFYRGDEIVSFDYQLDYSNDEGHQDKIPNNIFLHYHWQSVSDHSSTAGLAFLVTSGCLIACFLIMFAWVQEVQASGK